MKMVFALCMRSWMNVRRSSLRELCPVYLPIGSECVPVLFVCIWCVC